MGWLLRKPEIISLTDEHLDELKTGCRFMQASDKRASAENGYPVQSAGFGEVVPWSQVNGYAVMFYHPRDGKSVKRQLYRNNWRAWTDLNGVPI